MSSDTRYSNSPFTAEGPCELRTIQTSVLGLTGGKRYSMNPAENNREKFAIQKSYSIENGYPSRRRSLVDDAKFESSIKKQRKQTVIDEARQLSIETDFNEEELYLLSCKNEQSENFILILSLPDGMSSLPRIIKAIENFKGKICHVETRLLKDNTELEVLFKLQIRTDSLSNLLKHLRHGSSTSRISLLAGDKTNFKDTWFPHHISDLDRCNHLMTKYEPDLDMDHPGFSDKLYRTRRKQIADIAFSFKYGDKIPTVCYRAEEISTWATVFEELDRLIPSHACKQHQTLWNILKDRCGYSKVEIPQLQDVSDFIKSRTGFTLRPAAGLLTARDFLASLAFRVFQCTQYVRHHSSPHHSPEPDIIHELLGHAPLLADPAFANFSQELGLASLGATDEEIVKFSTMYWFTVEFGLCRENNQLKAWGAGLLSSFGELEHSLSEIPEIKSFDPSVTSEQPYQDQDYQGVYFVSDTIEDAQIKFRKWVVETLQRPYEIRYDPFSQSVCILDSGKEFQLYLNRITIDIEKLNLAIRKAYN